MVNNFLYHPLRGDAQKSLLSRENHPMTHELIPIDEAKSKALTIGGPLPALVIDSGKAAETAWDDFFAGRIRNKHTKRAYERAVRNFLAWAEASGRNHLAKITAGDVGRYIAGLAPEKKSISKKKQQLSALRRFFNLQVERHVCIINPAAVAETEKLSQTEGVTPIITYDDALKLYKVIDRTTLVGKRDLAVLATLNFTGRRAGAVAALDLDDLKQVGGHWVLEFLEKNNKVQTIPLPEDLEKYLFDWLDKSGIRNKRRKRDPDTGDWIPRPLFRSFVRKEKRLAEYVPEKIDPYTLEVIRPERGRLNGKDINRMMKRRLKEAGLPENLRPHSFRVAIATDLEDQGESLETRPVFPWPLRSSHNAGLLSNQSEGVSEFG